MIYNMKQQEYIISLNIYIFKEIRPSLKIKKIVL
jgi:hypothetical protein